MKRFLFISALLVVTNQNILGQIFAGTTTAQFLKIEVGARSISMGGAFVSLADDATAIYWNPAGIARLERNAVAFSHAYWLAETNHDFAGLVIKIGDQHAIGLSYTSLTMPDMAVRDVFYQEGTGEYFSASDIALGISYAINITQDFSIGFTGKYINQNIWHMNASSLAFDAGVRYSTPFEGLELGMSISNIGGKMKYAGEDNFIYYDFNADEHGNNDKIYADIQMDGWVLPLLFRVGVSYKLSLSKIHGLTISADALHPSDYNESLSTGFEYSFRDRFFLRAGYKSLFKLESEEGLTAGVGLVYFLTDYLPVRVDYAFADYGRLKEIHRFAIEVGF